MSESIQSAIDGITEITLGTGLDDEAHLQPERVNAEYVQDQKFKGVLRHFKIFNDTQMYYTLKSFGNKKKAQRRIHLGFVDERPRRDIRFAWKWLGTGLGTLALSILLFYIGLYTEYKHQYITIAAVLVGTFSLLSLMIFYYRTHDKLIYRSFVGGVPLFEISKFKANNKPYQNFMHTLHAHIQKGQAKKSMHERLIGELADLRRLRDEGMVSNDQYESARHKIFKHEAYQVK